MDTTGPYGDPPLALACYFRTIRWHDNQTCQPCHHQSPSLRAFCKALASMVGGLFSWVLLRSASLRRQQVGCPPWHPDQDMGWGTYSSSSQGRRAQVLHREVGHSTLLSADLSSQPSLLWPPPWVPYHCDPHPRKSQFSQEGIVEPTGPNGAMFCQETQGVWLV